VNVLSDLKALKTEMIPFLVGLLETGLEMQENPAATKAQIVKAIKAMQQSLKHGDTVSFFCRIFHNILVSAADS
jgi:hypothetical protein